MKVTKKLQTLTTASPWLGWILQSRESHLRSGSLIWYTDTHQIQWGYDPYTLRIRSIYALYTLHIRTIYAPHTHQVSVYDCIWSVYGAYMRAYGAYMECIWPCMERIWSVYECIWSVYGAYMSVYGAYMERMWISDAHIRPIYAHIHWFDAYTERIWTVNGVNWGRLGPPLGAPRASNTALLAPGQEPGSYQRARALSKGPFDGRAPY